MGHFMLGIAISLALRLATTVNDRSGTIAYDTLVLLVKDSISQ